MKVVICDDSIEDLRKLETLLIKYSNIRPGVKLELEKYSDAAALYEKIEEREPSDIYLLDLIMSEKTGIDIGSLLRKNGCESVIIYVTSSGDFALEAYGVHAARYLLKPVSEESFFEALDYAVSLKKPVKSSVYLMKTKDGLMSIPYSQIEYIENSARMLDVHLTNRKNIKSIFIRKSFDEEIGDIKSCFDFLQVHKSFLINLRYVRNLTQDQVVMESGKWIPVSKRRSAEVKKKYLLFVSKQHE